MMSKKEKEEKKEKPKGLNAILDSIRKEYGDGSIMDGLSAASIVKGIESFSTGSLALDIALGVGGIPRGRITEIYGPEGSGKTTLCLEAIATVQKAGLKAAFIDVENALVNVYATAVGVDMSKLIFSQPSSGEEAIDIAIKLAESGEVALIVVDSVAMLIPQAEIDGDVGDSHPGAQARLMAEGCRRLIGVLNKTNTALIFTNQLREKIGVMFGSPETQPGGRTLKFAASVRIDIRRIAMLEPGSNGRPKGIRVRTKVVKNKVAPPLHEPEFEIIFGEGIDHVGAMLEAAELVGSVKRSGSSYKFGDKSFAGKEKLRSYIAENPAYAVAIDKETRVKAGIVDNTVKPTKVSNEAEEPIDELKLGDE
jgi:recombination protein RecA